MQPISLTQYLITQQREGLIDAKLQQLIETMATACQTISSKVSQGALAGVLGEANSDNVQGERQKKLDILANQWVLEAHEGGGCLSGMVSEELEQIQFIPDEQAHGEYLLLFDPLDGSSNIDVNVSVGTIFSILLHPSDTAQVEEASFLQPGQQQLAAGYAIYGPSTMLVLTIGHGVQGFTLDRESSTFRLTHPGMSIPSTTSEYAINASNIRHWEPPIRRYIEECQQGVSGPRDRDFNMRWIASMVADVHRILIRGGVFLYPIDARCRKLGGKLRLLYEANPMALIVEQAGGAASTGYQRILEITPERLHQRVAVILGARDEVARLLHYHSADPH